MCALRAHYIVSPETWLLTPKSFISHRASQEPKSVNSTGVMKGKPLFSQTLSQKTGRVSLPPQVSVNIETQILDTDPSS